MTEKEVLTYLRDNNFDCCPECGNRRGNEIECDRRELDEDELATLSCANCGLGWLIPRPDDWPDDDQADSHT